MIRLDGNYCEGGGQIVRTALAFSAITGKPFEVYDIRKGRKNSGLKNQHLFCIKALKQLCNAETQGDFIGSEYLKFVPGKLKRKNLTIDIETAGSITLFLQAILVPGFFVDKKIKIDIIGGTDTKWSMPIEYLKYVVVPQLNRFCENIDVKLIKRGYYPKGNGNVQIEIMPRYKLVDSVDFDNFSSNLGGNEIDLTKQHHLIQIKGVSHASMDLQKANVAERQAKAAGLVLNKIGCPVTIRVEYSDTLSTGSGITLWAIFSKDIDDIDIKNPIRIGADSLGERGKKAEIVGKEAAEMLMSEINSKAPVDSHLADNLIPWLALFKGRIRTSNITNHTLTNIYVVEQFLGKTFEIDEKERLIKTIN